MSLPPLGITMPDAPLNAKYPSSVTNVIGPPSVISKMLFFIFKSSCTNLPLPCIASCKLLFDTSVEIVLPSSLISSTLRAPNKILSPVMSAINVEESIASTAPFTINLMLFDVGSAVTLVSLSEENTPLNVIGALIVCPSNLFESVLYLIDPIAGAPEESAFNLCPSVPVGNLIDPVVAMLKLVFVVKFKSSALVKSLFSSTAISSNNTEPVP